MDKVGPISSTPKKEEARRKAQAIWEKSAQRDAQIKNAQDSARRTESAKIARLRDLRLAKEAADKTAAAAAAAATTTTSRRTKAAPR